MADSIENKKKQILSELFEICRNKNQYVFTNDDVKEIARRYNFKNPFDVTKVDHSDSLPSKLREMGYCVIHLGKGKHKFVKALDVAYHEFEEDIISKNSVVKKYKPGLLDMYDTSEANILSVIFNRRIVHEFLYNDISAYPNIYFAKRTKASLRYWMEDEAVKTDKVQMEIDLILEYDRMITIFEGKNGKKEDFAVYQIYHPFLFYYNESLRKKLDVKGINCCYLLRYNEKIPSFTNAKRTVLDLYLYTFEEPTQMASIKLLKAQRYILQQV